MDGWGVIPSTGVALRSKLDKWCTSRPPDPTPIAIAKLDPMLDRKEVTIEFSVSELGGVAQLSVPGKAPAFVIEATSEHEEKDLTVWIEGELADVLDRLQLSYLGSNPLKKGTVDCRHWYINFSSWRGRTQRTRVVHTSR